MAGTRKARIAAWTPHGGGRGATGTMKRSTDRLLTTHTGSLPRPRPLLQMYDRRARGEPVDEEALALAGRNAMRSAVRRQLECGIDVGNNGEQQREGFFLYAQRRMTGFGGTWKRWPRGDYERYPLFREMVEGQRPAREGVNSQLPPRVVGAVRYRDPAVADIEAADFREALAESGGGFREAFLTAPSPGIIAAACKNEHYASEEAYVEALAEALRIEYEAVVRNGFVLQVDCPDLALERHRSYHGQPEADFLGFVERIVAALNRALRNVPRDRVRMHICWGNYEGPHDCDVPLETIWPLVRQARVGGYVLPFANARHAHEVDVLRRMPLADDQIIVAGVIDTLTNIIEHPEVIAERLERVVAAVGDRSRVLAGTDCGFDSTAGQGRVAGDVAYAKLRALAEGARIATARLF
jgi:5-methyltetrahydropteroyltriglutamate--homocysteine methyltransferase